MMRSAFVSLLLLASACQTPPPVTAPAPDGFAELSPAQGDDPAVVRRALSATGVMYRVRFAKQEPKADLAFWREALTRKLKDEGYVVTATEDVTLAGRPGALIRAVAPVAAVDYGFLVAFAPVDERVLIVEATGEQKEFAKLEPKVVAALQTVELKK